MRTGNTRTGLTYPAQLQIVARGCAHLDQTAAGAVARSSFQACGLPYMLPSSGKNEDPLATWTAARGFCHAFQPTAAEWA